jgi:hypothetical protein
MQNPTNQAGEASIPVETEIAINASILNRAFTMRREAAKPSETWYQTTSAPLSTPARKKQRLEEPRTRTTDEAARETPSPAASPESSLGLPPPADAGYNDDANADPVMQPNAGATGRWTLEEDAKLNSAVMKTCIKKHGKEQSIDWVAVAALVLSRTNVQCRCRWRDGFDIDRASDGASGRTGKWTQSEFIKLKKAVQIHGGKSWGAISALVPGRTEKECWNRWSDVSDANIGRVSGRKGRWTADEDSRLKDAVREYGGKNWGRIAAMVPGRGEHQCRHRWNDFLDPTIGAESGGKGKWTEVEDSRLEDAVRAHGGKDWAAIAALVPGRTKRDCGHRWKRMKDRSTVRKRIHGILKKAPASG